MSQTEERWVKDMQNKSDEEMLTKKEGTVDSDSRKSWMVETQVNVEIVGSSSFLPDIALCFCTAVSDRIFW